MVASHGIVDGCFAVFSLATAIATALTASIKLGLLDVANDPTHSTPRGARKRMMLRAASAPTMAAAVLGILAAIIAVGKGRSERVLTVLMFVGIVLPAAFALWATLHTKLHLRGWPLAGTLAGVATAAGALVLVTSPEVWRSVVSSRDIAQERSRAVRLASRPWYPGPTYECDAAKACSAPVEGATFNSFTNTSSEGDERFFVSARVVSRFTLIRRTESSLWFNTLEVAAGDEVSVKVYFRNAGCRPIRARPTSCVDTSTFIMQNARVGIFIPSTKSAGLTVLGVLYAENADPARVADRVALVSDEPFQLEYIPETARLFNEYSGGIVRNSSAPGYGTRVGPEVISDSAVIGDDPARFGHRMGAMVGYNKLDGVLHPGFGNQGYVSVRLRVV